MSQWKPISEYVAPPYKGFCPMVLVGWWTYGGGGYPAGVWHYAVGYLDLNKKWADASDTKTWPKQPTHFALICQDISQPTTAAGDKDNG